MSLNQAILHGKEKRRPYQGANADGAAIAIARHAAAAPAASFLMRVLLFVFFVFVIRTGGLLKKLV